jgi:prepilin signal peptidase PulO-like enzyme (type II secretory pathway)
MEMKEPKSQRRVRLAAILNRWRDVLTYAVIGAAVATLVTPAVAKFADRCANKLAISPIISCGVLSLFVIVVLLRFIDARLSHLRYIITYPPLSVAALIGLLALPLIQSIRGTRSLSLDGVGTVALAFAGVWLLHAFVSQVSEVIRCSLRRESPKTPNDEASLANWLRREQPINDPRADMFDNAYISERLVQRLSEGEATIALQGHFGSGKSSIGAMAATIAMQQGKPLIFSNVSCWGFGQSADAQEELLAEIVRSTTRCVDTFAVRQLPARYAAAVGGASSWSGVFAKLAFGRRNPLRVLQDLSPILIATGQRLVIFVEDIDRNFPTFDISQVEALLVRLRDVNGLSFVLCISPTCAVDLDRMCDYTEIIPTLDRAKTLKLIHSVRKYLLHKNPPNVVLGELQPLLLDDDGYKLVASHLDYYWPWQLVLHTLLRTPRILKRALRRVCAAWPRLAGEVHIDDLISIAALREGAPAAFRFFAKNYSLFRGAGKETPNLRPESRTKVKESLQVEWQEVSKDKAFDARSAAWLMKMLFPESASITGVSGTYSRHQQTMQSERRGEIYARRLLTESVKGEEISDQRILTLIRDAQTDDDSLAKLGDAITDSKFASDAFEEFGPHLGFTRYLPLLSNVYSVIRRRQSRTKYSRDDYPGFFAPWRLINDNRPANFEDWVVAELAKCIPDHLRLATDIYYFWLGTDHHTFDERQRSREGIHKTLNESWSKLPPSKIPDGFDPSHPYTLFHLIFTSDYQEAETVPVGKIEDWLWTARPLLDAARTRPTTILPQIVIALNRDTKRGSETPRFSFDEARLNAWFSDFRTELLQLLANGFEIPDGLGFFEQQLMQQAIEEAQRVMTEPSTSSVKPMHAILPPKQTKTAA